MSDGVTATVRGGGGAHAVVTAGARTIAKGHAYVDSGVESQTVDRRSQIGLALGGASLGGPFGEHTLHGPWLLRWGVGAAFGAAFAALLWDALKPR